MHEYLKVFKGPTGQPTAKLKIFDTCKQIIKTLPTLPQDENNPEAVADCKTDHWYDSLGYAIQAWHIERSQEAEKVEKYPPLSMGAMFGTPTSLAREQAQKARMGSAFIGGGK